MTNNRASADFARVFNVAAARCICCEPQRRAAPLRRRARPCSRSAAAKSRPSWADAVVDVEHRLMIGGELRQQGFGLGPPGALGVGGDLRGKLPLGLSQQPQRGLQFSRWALSSAETP